MGFLGAFVLLGSLGFSTRAALPPQFSECLYGDSSNASVSDLQAIAQSTPVTYCQTKTGMGDKYSVIDLLKTKNVQLGISLAKTNYQREDLIELAGVGSYLLYVDSGRLDKVYLADLLSKGVQLVVSSGDSSLSKYDLLHLAKTKSFIYHVNSIATKEELLDLAKAGVQLVLRSGKTFLPKEYIVEISKQHPGLVMLVP
ncbi:hypothetical protein AZI86_08930 [Bdellovibrio bacteriovorus]|uniref:GP-PDE domain-containing protein n=1 Tax=Bdellovibrio bacteriovorus TaxID=959 RepID=A0A150WS21_BDEBC|nr:hypothetical protein [Bdellovibrio bacteriovorus]KYG67124.1 hypothetical protein AZI86_08930 [Bdellovibrio bacteriovorus]